MTFVEISSHDLNTSTEIGDAAITARLSGTAETASKAALGAYFLGLHAAAASAGVREVVVDLRPLLFMNSSCFKTLVVWIAALQESAPEQRYTIRFVSDETKYWQARSLAALACFAEDLIQVQAQAA